LETLFIAEQDVSDQPSFIVTGILVATSVITLVYASQKWGTKSDTTFRQADSSAQQTLLNAWIANAGQLVLSFCYLASKYLYF
jgi:hypothetical protein